MTRAALSGFLALAAALVSPAALADEAPPPLPPAAPAASAPAAAPGPVVASAATVDEVHLRSGGLLRGHVTEIVPGDHVTIVVEGGESKRLPWGELDRVVVSSENATGAAPAGSGPRARVHIRSSKNVILYRRPAGTTSWERACESPCDAELPVGDDYRITGNGVPASPPFRLDAGPGGSVTLDVDPASTGGMIAGGFIAATGATAGYVGLVLAAVGQGAMSGRDGSGLGRDRGEDVRNAGLVTLAVGAAVTVGGILMFVSAGKTEIKQSSSSSAEASTGRTLDAFLRRPTWSAGADSARGAPAATFPVVFQQAF